MLDPHSIIMSCDFAQAEAMRGNLNQSQVADLVETYHRLSDWKPKDITIHLLQDCKPVEVRSVMQDALRSPTPESRAIAVCSLAEDWTLFDGFLRNGFVSAEAVDQAIQEKFGTVGPSTMRLMFIDGLWLGRIPSSYGDLELIMGGDASGPQDEQRAAVDAFLQRAETIIERLRRKLSLPFLWRPIRIAPNNQGRVGVQFQHRVMNRRELLFADEATGT
jgi:hypothetical protein